MFFVTKTNEIRTSIKIQTMAKQNVRMKAWEYRNEVDELQKELTALKNRISVRLLTLCKRFPEAPVQRMGDTDIKAKSITTTSIANIELDYQITMIGRIEAWVELQNPVKQMTFICNCDARDMPVYEEDGKRWCPQCGYEVK
jgi:hypothetical protein